MGSGFTTHNLREMNWAGGPHGAAPSWSVEFDDWVTRAIAAGDLDALSTSSTRPRLRARHPRTEHFAPLFVALGASIESLEDDRSAIDGYWYGLSKRSFQFD